MEATAQKKYLTPLNKFSFAAAGFGQNLIIGLVNSYILFFYTDVFLLSAPVTATLMLVARIWDALNDPIMGSIVDKTRTRFGKLRPYLLATPIPLALTTSLLFFVPDFGEVGKSIYACVTYLAWGMVYTVCDIPFWGLPAVLTPNAEERVPFISFTRLFHVVGNSLPIILVPLIISLVGGDAQKGYLFAGIACGVIGGGLFSFAFFGTEERCHDVHEDKPKMSQILKAFWHNKPLKLIVLANVLGFMRALPVTSSLYIATYLLGNTSLNIIVLGAWGVSGLIGMLVSGKLAKRYTCRRIYLTLSSVGLLSSLILFVSGYSSPVVLLLSVFVSGFPYGVITTINYGMISESIDYTEWKTGMRTEGFSVSFQTLMNQMMGALQTSLLAWMLIWINFRQPVKNELGDLITQIQTPETLNGLFFIVTILPAIGWALSMIPIAFYDFSGKKKEKIYEELYLRRAIANGELVYDPDAELARLEYQKAVAERRQRAQSMLENVNTAPYLFQSRQKRQ